MNDGVLALPVHDFPLILVDIQPGILDILENVVIGASEVLQLT